MKKNSLIILIIIIVLSLVFLSISVSNSKKQKADSLNQNIQTKVFSIGEKKYFQIPPDKIQSYTLSENETLFFSSEEEEKKDTKSVVDIFSLTPTVVYWMNEEKLQPKRIASVDQNSTFYVIDGPFYLKTSGVLKTFELMFDGYSCCQIDCQGLSEDLSLHAFKGKGVHQVILKDNVLSSSVIDDNDNACLLPLVFYQDPSSPSEKPDLAIVPEVIIEEALFMNAKKAECVLEVSNSDYELLVRVLRAFSSYLEIGD